MTNSYDIIINPKEYDTITTTNNYDAITTTNNYDAITTSNNYDAITNACAWCKSIHRTNFWISDKSLCYEGRKLSFVASESELYPNSRFEEDFRSEDWNCYNE